MSTIPKYTPQANRAIEIAKEEATLRYKHRVNTVFLLFGLVIQRDSMSTVMLRELGVDMHGLRHELYGLIGKRIAHLDVAEFTPHQNIIYSENVQLSMRAATNLAKCRGLDRPVEDEDLLLAMSLIRHSAASVLLEKFEVTPRLLEQATYTLVMPA